MAKRISTSQSGFSLVEVLFAMLIFSVMTVGVFVNFSGNLSSSIRMNNDLSMHNLAEMKLNEVLVAKKEFTDATDNSADTGTFKVEGYKDYKYKVEIRKMEFPNLAEITGEEDDGPEDNKKALTKVVYSKLKTNIEQLLWQVTVTVIHPTEKDLEYQLHSWIRNDSAKIDTNFTF